MNQETLPYIEVFGTHKDVGAAIGGTMKPVIVERIRQRRREIPKYAAHLAASEPYYNAAQHAFPHLVEELGAIAQAAGVPVADYFFVNTREVFDTQADHCTIAVSFGKDGAVVGHNEDWTREAIDQLYVLKATIGETTFLGLQYAMELPGVSASINSWGLVQCVNDLQSPSRVGVPKPFLARAILECKTIDEAEKVIAQTDRASGFNHVLVQGSTVCNIELSGDALAVERKLQQPYVHTNHYLSETMRQRETARSDSSVARYERARQLIKPGMTKEDMIALLSDTKNKTFPICRETETIGSVVLLPQAKEAWICRGHPCAGDYEKYGFDY